MSALLERARDRVAYFQLREQYPLVPARRVFEYVRYGEGESLQQYFCPHEWNRSAGEADEAFLSGDYGNDNIRCVLCGADGDA